MVFFHQEQREVKPEGSQTSDSGAVADQSGREDGAPVSGPAGAQPRASPRV